jgi:hypothetical protein
MFTELCTMEKEKNTSETPAKAKPYNWTEKRKRDAHRLLLIQYNKTEPQQLNKLNIEYQPDGTARSKTKGRMKSEYSINFKEHQSK